MTFVISTWTSSCPLGNTDPQAQTRRTESHTSFHLFCVLETWQLWSKQGGAPGFHLSPGPFSARAEKEELYLWTKHSVGLEVSLHSWKISKKLNVPLLSDTGWHKTKIYHLYVVWHFGWLWMWWTCRITETHIFYSNTADSMVVSATADSRCSSHTWLKVHLIILPACSITLHGHWLRSRSPVLLWPKCWTVIKMNVGEESSRQS